MALERGPFVCIPDSALPFEPGVWDNESWVQAALVDVGGFLDDISAALDVLVVIDLSDFAPDLDAGLVDAFISQGGDWIGVFTGITDTIDGAAIVGDSNFADALNAAPAGTWEADPQLYTPPAGIEGLPSGAGSGVPAAGQAGIHLSVTPPPGYTFSLVNLTTYGSPSFSVGDQFALSLSGPAGTKVSVLTEVNGTSLGTAFIGYVGDDGTFTLTGTEGPTEIGTWVEEWFVGNQLVAIAEFSVLP